MCHVIVNQMKGLRPTQSVERCPSGIQWKLGQPRLFFISEVSCKEKSHALTLTQINEENNRQMLPLVCCFRPRVAEITVHWGEIYNQHR